MTKKISKKKVSRTVKKEIIKKEDKVKTKSQESSIEKLASQFNKNLELIRDYIELVAPLLSKEGKKQFKRDERTINSFIKALNSFAKSPDSKGKEKYFKIETEGQKTVLHFADSKIAKDVMSATDNLEKIGKRSSFLYQTSLLSLISNVELFWSQLLQYIPKSKSNVSY